MIGDLHCHTRLSDGSMSIDDLVYYARRAGLSFLSVTDHDTMDGVTRAMVLGRRFGVRIVPGVELSAWDASGDREVHVLCYLPEKPDRLSGLMAANLQARAEAGREMTARVTRYYPVTEEHIARCAAGSRAVYPAHILQALGDLGYGHRGGAQLYRRLFHPGSGLCAVRPSLPEVLRVIEQVQDAGGIAVLAHPGGALELARELAVLLDGLEVYHPGHGGETQRELADLAEQWGLLVTGGSDFHGYLSHAPNPLATCVVGEAELQAVFRFKRRLPALSS